ncbi:hypothetical protein [Peristeroidobacter agariperforans]|uniref:hypothetical protein n=1 Tax=Peristeroidobacter agariperforans TaxID=268404 RepID=UPI00101BB68A|nr:hypothetical protein [Peristeroidobacter agariperforans]
MAKLEVVCASGALMLSALLLGCANAPSQRLADASQAQAAPAKRAVAKDRTPSWQKYRVSGSRIARTLDANGKPTTADYVQSTTSDGLHMLPAVTMTPCERTRHGC